MEGDSLDHRLDRLFTELRQEDGEQAPPFGALVALPASTGQPRPAPLLRHLLSTRWATAASLLTAATALVMVKFAFFGPQPSTPDSRESTTSWSTPTDSLLGGTGSFGSLETWQSPTDSLFDFAPVNTNT